MIIVILVFCALLAIPAGVREYIVMVRTNKKRKNRWNWYLDKEELEMKDE